MAQRRCGHRRFIKEENRLRRKTGEVWLCLSMREKA
jgi:hypothetical protein